MFIAFFLSSSSQLLWVDYILFEQQIATLHSGWFSIAHSGTPPLYDTLHTYP